VRKATGELRETYASKGDNIDRGRSVKLLALDTSSDACSVALQLDDEVHETHRVEPRMHTGILLPMIKGLLNSTGTKIDSLDAIVLGNGPGSFIGMRIGASVAQGMAFAAARKIVAVSSLAAVAAEVMDTESADAVVVTQDARMSEVYVGAFVRGDADLPVSLVDEAIFPAGSLAALSERSDWVAAGAGWKRYPALAKENNAQLARQSTLEQPRASSLLGLARQKLEAGEAVAPDQVQPAYLRHKVATIPSA
jgi:tRNA threonylcarbamoyladenosine biosynthesis protein TsaB